MIGLTGKKQGEEGKGKKRTQRIKNHRRFVGLIGVFLFGYLLCEFINLFQNKALNPIFPFWVWLILPFFISMMFMFSCYLILF